MITSGIQSPPTTPGLFNSSPTPTKLLMSDSRSASVDPLQYHKTGRNQPSPPNGLLDNATFADVKVHYCSQVYEAVSIAIRQSLYSLINSLDWRQLQVERYDLVDLSILTRCFIRNMSIRNVTLKLGKN